MPVTPWFEVCAQRHSSCLRALEYRWASQVARVVENPPANAVDIRDTGSVPGSGRFPGGGHGSSLQCSCLENSMGRGTWRATVRGVAERRTWVKRLSTHTRVPLLWVTFLLPSSAERSFLVHCLNLIFTCSSKDIFSFVFLFWLSTHLVHSNTDNNVTKMSTNYWNIYSFNMHTQPCKVSIIDLPVYRWKEQGL